MPLVLSAKWFLLLMLIAAMAAVASTHPALPQDELAVLEKDLEEDLQDLEDARAVDEAYERLYDHPLFAELTEDADPAEAPLPDQTNLPFDDYDGEMPQGDQPMPDAQPEEGDDTQNTSTRAASTPATGSDRPDDAKAASPATSPSTPSGQQGPLASRKSDRERDRELRLQHIKSQVLHYLGLPPDGQHPLSNMSSNRQQLSVLRVVGQMNLPNLPPQDIIAEKVTSHYPACTLPRNTDEALWSEGRSMRLLFELPNHPPPAGTSANVVQATLRLFKVSQGSSATHANHGPLCVPSVATTAAAAAAYANANPNDDDDGLLDGDGHAPVPLHALLGMVQADDRQVRVSVYWYTRSLKKNKNGVVVEKRKLLDSRMLAVHGSAWTEWNVRPAVKVWRDSGRNFGLVVEVEDEDGTRLDAHQFFNGMNCTQEASNARPIPSFLLDRLHHSNASGSGYREPGGAGASAGAYANAFNQNLFPVIDLCTVETTDSSGGGALSSSGYDFGGLGLGRQSKQAVKHKQAAQAARAVARGHKHRHQHQDDVQDADEEAEPVARRWPRARTGQEERTLHQRIVLAARQHPGKDR